MLNAGQSHTTAPSIAVTLLFNTLVRRVLVRRIRVSNHRYVHHRQAIQTLHNIVSSDPVLADIVADRKCWRKYIIMQVFVINTKSKHGMNKYNAGWSIGVTLKR